MIIKGQLIEKSEANKITEKFTKREFVIQTDGKFNNTVIMQLVNDKCNLIDGFNIGSTIEVHYNLEGRKYNDKYYNSVIAWKIEGEKQTQAVSDKVEADLPF